MLKEVGYCNGVENYARHLSGREPGSAPECLIDYFPKDWLLFLDDRRYSINRNSKTFIKYNGEKRCLLFMFCCN